MGKLVLTRRAGESVKLVEANGDTWLVTVEQVGIFRDPNAVRIRLKNLEFPCYAVSLRWCDAISVAGGSLELRPTKRHWPDQAVLAFDFPRDVKIVRTEIA